MANQTVQLRRFDTSQPWGFKMQGGTDVGQPLFVASVNPNSISGHAGLKVGDAIIQIGKTSVAGFTHEQARSEMIRSGNDIDLTVQRGAVEPIGQLEPPVEEPPRMSVSDAEDGYRDVQPKTYKVLDEELPKAAATGARPASIFDKNKDKRSDYTRASKSGYLKAYGQTK